MSRSLISSKRYILKTACHAGIIAYITFRLRRYKMEMAIDRCDKVMVNIYKIHVLSALLDVRPVWERFHFFVPKIVKEIRVSVL